MSTEDTVGADAHAQSFKDRAAPPSASSYSQHNTPSSNEDRSFVRPADLLRPRAATGPPKSVRIAAPETQVDREEKAGLVSA